MSIDGARVLVTDAHANPALAAVRSLGARGLRITVMAEEGRLNLAGASRFVEGVVVAPQASSRPAEYANALARELRRVPYALLLPVTDTTVAVVSERRAELQPLTTLALPERDQLRFAVDKLATLELAATTAVAFPATRTFETVQEALDEAESVAYPCVIKGRYSRRWSGQGPVQHGAVRFVPSSAAFRTLYPTLHRPEAAPLVQEFTPGSGVGVFALVDRGRVLTAFVHRRLREVNPTGGPASLAESVAPEDRLVAPAIRLLEAAGWHGVAMVEFKDPGHGREPRLMEINGRLWGSLPLAIAAGVDFPYLLAQLFLGETPDVPAVYRAGVRCRHLRGDLSYLGGVLRGAPDGWTEGFPSRFRTLVDIAPWPGRWRPYTMRITDPWPGIVEAWQFVKEELLGSDPAVAIPATEAPR